jgi:hypothetical protein
VSAAHNRHADRLVVAKLDRLARSVANAKATKALKATRAKVARHARAKGNTKAGRRGEIDCEATETTLNRPLKPVAPQLISLARGELHRRPAIFSDPVTG